MFPSCTSAAPERLAEMGVRLRRHLAEAAFLACISNDVEGARRIAKGLDAIAQGCRESVIAYALADLTAGDVEAALQQLGPLSDAEDAYGMVFQALALHLGGRMSERDAVLRRIPGGQTDVDGLVAAFRNNSVGYAVDRGVR